MSNQRTASQSKAAATAARKAEAEQGLAMLEAIRHSPATQSHDLSHILFSERNGLPLTELVSFSGERWALEGVAMPHNFPLAASQHQPGSSVLAGDQEIRQLVKSNWLEHAQEMTAQQAKLSDMLRETLNKPARDAVHATEKLPLNRIALVAAAVLGGIGIAYLLNKRSHQSKLHAQREATVDSPFASR